MSPKQRYNPETVGTQVADLSHQDVIRRFKKLHYLRLERLQGFLLAKQQVFISLLPLLLHQNIPLLPGFIDADTPFGIANYVPDGQTLLTAKVFSKSYSYKNTRSQQPAIDAIFLMGNVGSIAFAKNHPIDIWIYHHRDLTTTQRAALQLKVDSISAWAATLGLLVQSYLIDSAAFLKGHATPVTIQGNGDLQHYLLLEAFYRAAIHIAGKFPVWWLVPPQEEKNYATHVQYLQKQRFIQEHDLIDLGGIAGIQPEEFISATFWQLYSALYKPYTALLPLLLLECYVSEYPQPDWLCLHLKQAVYEGVMDVDELDPYTLIYRKIEDYCQNQPERLLLARYCFYLTVVGTFALPANPTLAQMQRMEFVQQVAQDWQWPADLLPVLISNKTWNINKANADFALIQAQLQQNYASISAFIQHYAPESNNDYFLELIRRQLQAFLSPKPGKIDVLSTQSSVRIQAEEFSLLEQVIPDEPSVWWLFSGKVIAFNTEDQLPIKRLRSYFEALVWLVANGVYHKRMLLTVVAQSMTLPPLECHRICRYLQQLLINHIETPAQRLEAYRTIDSGLVTLAFINLGDVEDIVRNDSKYIVNQQADALRYGTGQHCLIQSIDSVTLSKWGEMTVKRYSGQAGLFDYFTDILNTLAKPLQPQQFELACYTPMRGNIILYRMNHIFKQLCAAFVAAESPQLTRYLLAVGNTYYCIQRREDLFTHWEMSTKAQLYKVLSTPQDNFCHTVFDSEIGINTLISIIYTFNQPGKIQFFYLSDATEITVYILDEKGALFKQQHALINIDQLLQHYSMFLEDMLKRYFSGRELCVDYYEMLQMPSKGLSCRTVSLKSLSVPPQLAIRLKAEQAEDKVIRYHINCNERVFTTREYGAAVFSQASDFIAHYRRDHRHSNLQLTTVEVPLSVMGVSGPEQLQSIHVLHYKQKIEARLQI
ncbi:MAG: adenylate cyclase [Methylococcaceae bacterium]|nr:adenylate cyclase [Methylococcaceae bacterium]